MALLMAILVSFCLPHHCSTAHPHPANWDCVSVIVKTGGDLRQEQLAVQLIREFQGIWTEEKCACWVK